jgi:hypothetical protein
LNAEIVGDQDPLLTPVSDYAVSSVDSSVAYFEDFSVVIQLPF